MRTGTLEDALVKVEVVLGGKELTLRELANLGPGSVIELDSLAGEPVELVAGGERIARGEVVIIDENFGLRVTGLFREEAGS
jgi:flagellar motor switch protein FliN/FliY